ncbi:hypothetical protein B7P43_G05171 [Cryptotermes secundus]|uniref:CCHC-type domain-containing protein n=1 Tax=Cryptotermes secundus TaxID=105785 RepID=A0A2J7RNB4_9NEOP|nr:hypothetical protein B7P43_G05171 [Cryptotermes secundus]
MEILQTQMEELRVQLETLRIGETHRGQNKDVSLVAGIKEWALQFLNGREVLGRDGCSYEVLRQTQIERFSDKLPDQYYYTRLEDAVQGKNESVEEFSDRCRKMCLRIIRKVNDEETQRIINEEAERRFLAAYVHCLRGIVGQQVQYQMPSTMEQAVWLAVTVENVEKHKQLTEGVNKVFTARSYVEYFRCRKRGHYARDCRQETPSKTSVWRSWRDQSSRRRYPPSRNFLLTRGGRGRVGSGRQSFRGPARPLSPPEDTRS